MTKVHPDFLLNEEIMHRHDALKDIDNLPSGGSSFGKILFVDPTATAGTGVKGNSGQPYKTGDEAKAAAVAGDKVEFLPGDHSVGITASIAQDGVYHYWHDGAIVNTSMLPALYDVIAFTTGLFVTGYGGFTTVNEFLGIDDDATYEDIEVEVRSVITTGADCIEMSHGTGGDPKINKLKLKGHFKSTGGRAIGRSGTGIAIFVRFLSLQGIFESTFDRATDIQFQDENNGMVNIDAKFITSTTDYTMYFNNIANNDFTVKIDGTIIGSPNAIQIESSIGAEAYTVASTGQGNIFLNATTNDYRANISFTGAWDEGNVTMDGTTTSEENMGSITFSGSYRQITWIGGPKIPITVSGSVRNLSRAIFQSAFADTNMVFSGDLGAYGETSVAANDFIGSVSAGRVFVPGYIRCGIYSSVGARTMPRVVISGTGIFTLSGTIEDNGIIGSADPALHNIEIINMDGGTFELQNGVIKSTRNDSANDKDSLVKVEGDSDFIHRGGTMVVGNTTGAFPFDIDTAITLTVTNLLDVFMNVDVGGAGTYSIVGISGGGVKRIDANVK